MSQLDIAVVKRNQVEMAIDRWYEVGEDEQYLFEDANPKKRSDLDADYVGLYIDENEDLALRRLLVKFVAKDDKHPDSMIATEIVSTIVDIIISEKDKKEKVRNPIPEKISHKDQAEPKKISKKFAKTFVNANRDLFTDQSNLDEKIKAITSETSRSYTSLLVITKTTMSPRANAIFSDLSYFCHWNVMLDDKLMYNPTKHVFVPPHRIVPKMYMDEKLKELNATKEDLEMIRTDDPIVIYYEARIGDVMKIIRDDGYIPTPGPKSVAYRRVVKAIDRGIKKG
jgi:DNA-directed RNA polymerase subunit H (RpoH/RPB5)